MRQELQECGVTLYSSPVVNNKLAILLFPLWFSYVYLRYKTSVIHSHTEISDLTQWLFQKIAWMFFWVRPKYIRTIHNTELWNEWKGIGKMVERFYVKYHCNIAISLLVREAYEKAFGQGNIPLIYNGVEEVEQESFPYLVENKVNVLFAGRLEQQKGDRSIGSCC